MNGRTASLAEFREHPSMREGELPIVSDIIDATSNKEVWPHAGFDNFQQLIARPKPLRVLTIAGKMNV